MAEPELLEKQGLLLEENEEGVVVWIPELVRSLELSSGSPYRSEELFGMSPLAMFGLRFWKGL